MGKGFYKEANLSFIHIYVLCFLAGTDVCVIGSDNCDRSRSHCVITKDDEDFYRCSCNDGYNKTYNNITTTVACLNFCEQGIDMCNRETTNCTATPGTSKHYNCTCKRGYNSTPDDGFKCTLQPKIFTSNSTEPNNGELVLAILVSFRFVLLFMCLEVFWKTFYFFENFA